ncbi:hypothetical protein EsH8_IV_001385 [Colletotrichum jinshuiense]
MANDQRYREIRPAFKYQSNDIASSSPDATPERRIQAASGEPSQTPSLGLQHKRRNVLVACEACKKRKVKCSADRPQCSACVAKGVECQYNADPFESRVASLKRKHDDLERRHDCLQELFSAMQSMPEGQVHEILKRIRSGVSAEDLVHQIEAGRLLVKLASSRETWKSQSNATEAKMTTEARGATEQSQRFDVNWAYPSRPRHAPLNVT